MTKRLKILILLLFCALFFGGYVYRQLFIKKAFSEEYTLFITEQDNWNSVFQKLNKDKTLNAPFLVNSLAKKMNVNRHIYPGRYTFKEQSIREMLTQLRQGKYDQIRISLHQDIKHEEFAEIHENVLNVTKEAINQEIDSICNQKMLISDQFYATILADVYFFNWSATAKEILKFYEKQWNKYWTKEQKLKAKKLGLSPIDVSILASIVDHEAVHKDEMPMIAGVYLNRLKSGWKLAADPSVRFFLPKGRQRVLYKDLKSKHPYNTYNFTGLPPGPIGLPTAKSIDAVLNAKDHNYMFFVARADNSLRHDFSISYAEHEAKAEKYHQFLNQRTIKE